MSDEQELARKHLDLLVEMKTSREIARFLESEGVQGVKKIPQICAISAWLTDKVSGITVNTMYSGVRVRELKGLDGFRIPSTPAMNTFLHAFDRGQYPKLVKEVP